MGNKFVYILDFCLGCLNIIELTDEEQIESEQYDDFEDFLSTIEDKYGFKLSNCQWMFSDEIDDEDLEFMRHDYVTYNMACEYYRLGIKPVVRMAHEAGAVYKIGKKVLIRRSIFEAYLREKRKI